MISNRLRTLKLLLILNSFCVATTLSPISEATKIFLKAALENKTFDSENPEALHSAIIQHLNEGPHLDETSAEELEEIIKKPYLELRGVLSDNAIAIGSVPKKAPSPAAPPTSVVPEVHTSSIPASTDKNGILDFVQKGFEKALPRDGGLTVKVVSLKDNVEATDIAMATGETQAALKGIRDEYQGAMDGIQEALKNTSQMFGGNGFNISSDELKYDQERARTLKSEIEVLKSKGLLTTEKEGELAGILRLDIGKSPEQKNLEGAITAIETQISLQSTARLIPTSVPGTTNKAKSPAVSAEPESEELKKLKTQKAYLEHRLATLITQQSVKKSPQTEEDLEARHAALKLGPESAKMQLTADIKRMEQALARLEAQKNQSKARTVVDSQLEAHRNALLDQSIAGINQTLEFLKERVLPALDARIHEAQKAEALLKKPVNKAGKANEDPNQKSKTLSEAEIKEAAEKKFEDSNDHLELRLKILRSDKDTTALQEKAALVEQYTREIAAAQNDALKEADKLVTRQVTIRQEEELAKAATLKRWKDQTTTTKSAGAQKQTPSAAAQAAATAQEPVLTGAPGIKTDQEHQLALKTLKSNRKIELARIELEKERARWGSSLGGQSVPSATPQTGKKGGKKVANKAIKSKNRFKPPVGSKPKSNKRVTFAPGTKLGDQSTPSQTNWNDQTTHTAFARIQSDDFMKAIERLEQTTDDGVRFIGQNLRKLHADGRIDPQTQALVVPILQEHNDDGAALKTALETYTNTNHYNVSDHELDLEVHKLTKHQLANWSTTTALNESNKNAIEGHSEKIRVNGAHKAAEFEGALAAIKPKTKEESELFNNLRDRLLAEADKAPSFMFPALLSEARRQLGVHFNELRNAVDQRLIEQENKKPANPGAKRIREQFTQIVLNVHIPRAHAPTTINPAKPTEAVIETPITDGDQGGAAVAEKAERKRMAHLRKLITDHEALDAKVKKAGFLKKNVFNSEHKQNKKALKEIADEISSHSAEEVRAAKKKASTREPKPNVVRGAHV